MTNMDFFFLSEYELSLSSIVVAVGFLSRDMLKSVIEMLRERAE